MIFRKSFSGIFLATILCTVIFTGVSSFSCRAEPTGKLVIGFVDISQVMMFHPLMRNFDAVNHRFLLQESSGRQKSTAAAQAIESRLVKLRQEKTALDQAIAATEEKFLEKLRSLAQEKGTLTTGNAREEYNKERRFIESEFRQKVRDIRVSFKAKEELIAAAERELNTAHLADHEETARTFKLILDEIDQVIAQEADRKGVQVVFNNSFSPDRVPSGAGDSISNPMPGFFDRLEAGLGDAETEGVLLSSLLQWSREANWNLVHCLDRRLDRLVVKGGVDLTPAVVDGILVKHKVSQRHREIMSKLFRLAGEP